MDPHGEAMDHEEDRSDNERHPGYFGTPGYGGAAAQGNGNGQLLAQLEHGAGATQVTSSTRCAGRSRR